MTIELETPSNCIVPRLFTPAPTAMYQATENIINMVTLGKIKNNMIGLSLNLSIFPM